MTVVSVSAVENIASVEVLPMTMLSIANERKTAMKKIMMAVGFAARIHIGIAYASKRDQNRKWRFTCKTIARPAAASERSR